MKNSDDRFDDKWFPEPNTGCWLWFGAHHEGGYGRFFDGERVIAAHRYAWKRWRGPIPDVRPRLVIDHLCRTPQCVNPEHLDLVTDKVNQLRGVGTLAAIALSRDVCPRGHRYDVTRYNSGRRPRRGCSECERTFMREQYRKRRRAAGFTVRIRVA